MSSTNLFRPAESSARGGGSVAALAFYLRGNAWSEFGKLDLAIADYDAALAINPMLGAALADRGDAWARKGDLDRAIADYDTALRLNPQDHETRKRRAMALESKHEWKTRGDEPLN